LNSNLGLNNGLWYDWVLFLDLFRKINDSLVVAHRLECILNIDT